MELKNNTITAKVMAMCVLFIVSMVLGSVPVILSKHLKMKSDTKSNPMVQLLLCFGGGVLMFTTFIHLLPEVADNLKLIPDFANIKLPIAELLMCSGFFLMYLVEELMHTYLNKKQVGTYLEPIRQRISISWNSRLDSDTEIKTDCVRNECHSHLMIGDGSMAATVRGFLVVLALAVHELFEGLAIGLESSTVTVWYMFGAVSAHKFVIAFCIGVELVSSGMKAILITAYIFLFAVVSPLGIGIGIAISEGAPQSSIALPSVVLQGVASGTLLYVVFFEILRTDRKNGLKQYFSVLIGFVVMMSLSFIKDD